ncbi:hypothetical protein GGX14DRAFT_693402 [Mycena pura]|uniref:AAA-ATPase-like domain-containing protein n=1 Tax=Mycena pura TaxID=153505 RepID=A0AAD6YP54_9AGAR|nr:hypothetical protein GGX14DRAFT_693402 [Mycena pura]
MTPTNQTPHSHDMSCTCSLCIEQIVHYTPEKGLHFQPSPDTERSIELPKRISRSDASDTASSLQPSSPSVGSKRSWIWSDGEDSDGDSEYSYKRLRRQSSSDRPRIYLPRSDDTFINFCNLPGTVFVDKTQCISLLPDRFRYVLLRPPRFGKSTLLTTLLEYYDIHGANRFAERFGSLAVVTQGPQSAARHSQHLCLSFNLGSFSVYSSVAEFTACLTSKIYFVLGLFVARYCTELGFSKADKSLTDANITFEVIFKLVRAHNRTLFVTIDDFDSPFRTWSSGDFGRQWGLNNLATPQDIVELLDLHLWEPLLAGSDVIHKLLMAGTILPDRSLLQQLQISTSPELKLSCGFSVQETKQFIASTLSETVDVADLENACGGYVFSSEHDSDTGSLLQPQQIMDWISKRTHSRDDNANPFRLLSNILDVLPEESSDPCVPTVNRLIGLLAAGVVEMDCEMDALIDHDPKAPIWSALYYAGALTNDPRRPRTYRIPNSTALSLIHSRGDNLFADRHKLQRTFFDSWAAYCGKRPDARRFLSLLSRVLRDEAQRCLVNGSRQEPDLRGVFELVMCNKHTEGLDASPPVILLPDDAPVQVQDYYPQKELLTLDLKTVTLLGMWRGEHPDEHMPTVKELQQLHADLRDLDDGAILERQCRVWSPTPRAMEIVRVGDLLESEPQHAQFLAVGGDRVLVRLPQLAVSEEEEAEEEEEDGGLPEFDYWCAADLMKEEDADQWKEGTEDFDACHSVTVIDPEILKQRKLAKVAMTFGESVPPELVFPPWRRAHKRARAQPLRHSAATAATRASSPGPDDEPLSYANLVPTTLPPDLSPPSASHTATPVSFAPDAPRWI